MRSRRGRLLALVVVSAAVVAMVAVVMQSRWSMRGPLVQLSETSTWPGRPDQGC